jgi:hypothetical protein
MRESPYLNLPVDEIRIWDFPNAKHDLP